MEGKLTANLATEVMLEVYASIMSLPDCVSVINSLLEAFGVLIVSIAFHFKTIVSEKYAAAAS